MTAVMYILLDLAQEALNEVLQAYVVHAMESGAGWLVPQLACHLRAGRRHLTWAPQHTQFYPCYRAFLQVSVFLSCYHAVPSVIEALLRQTHEWVDMHLLLSFATTATAPAL